LLLAAAAAAVMLQPTKVALAAALAVFWYQLMR
jgi:hypothetical protein